MIKIENSNISLCNLANYKSKLSSSLQSIFANYGEIVSNYINLFYECIKIENKDYFYYLFKNGLMSITHIFNMLLLYTNNLELTQSYCQNSLFYYVEFISQIDNINHSFLELNGKDASLFIYKKSIFEINNDIKKNANIKNNIKITNAKLLTNIYVKLIEIIYNNKFTRCISSENSSLDNLMKIQASLTEIINDKKSLNEKKLLDDKKKNEIVINNKLVIIDKFVDYFTIYVYFKLNNNNQHQHQYENQNQHQNQHQDCYVINNLATYMQMFCVKLNKNKDYHKFLANNSCTLSSLSNIDNITSLSPSKLIATLF